MKYYSPLPVGPPHPRFTDGPSTSAHFVILTFYKNRGGQEATRPRIFFESLLFGSPGTSTGAGTAGGLGGASASMFSIFAILAGGRVSLLPADCSLFALGDDKDCCADPMDPESPKLRMTAFTDSDNFFPLVALYAFA